jgi:hypothetical protein
LNNKGKCDIILNIKNKIKTRRKNGTSRVNLGGSFPTGDDIDELIKLIKRKWSDSGK